MFSENIEKRDGIRKKLSKKAPPGDLPLLMISESIDYYIEHRIQTDKVIEGILKDIQGNLADIAQQVEFRTSLDESKRLN